MGRAALCQEDGAGWTLGGGTRCGSVQRTVGRRDGWMRAEPRILLDGVRGLVVRFAQEFTLALHEQRWDNGCCSCRIE